MYSHTYSHTLIQRFTPVSYIEADWALRPQAAFRKATENSREFFGRSNWTQIGAKLADPE